MNETVKKHALRILEKRDVSRKMLIDKLTAKGASEADAGEVADWLCGLGAVNDARYAELVVRHYAGKGYGLRRIQEELFHRGVPRELWEDALVSLPETEDTVYRLLCARLRGTDATPGDIQRARNALLRRGFSWEEIRGALEHYQAENEEME